MFVILYALRYWSAQPRELADVRILFTSNWHFVFKFFRDSNSYEKCATCGVLVTAAGPPALSSGCDSRPGTWFNQKGTAGTSPFPISEEGFIICPMRHCWFICTSGVVIFLYYMLEEWKTMEPDTLLNSNSRSKITPCQHKWRLYYQKKGLGSAIVAK